MRVKTILNRVQKQPGFVYGAIRFIQARGAGALEVEVRYGPSRTTGRHAPDGVGVLGYCRRARMTVTNARRSVRRRSTISFAISRFTPP